MSNRSQNPSKARAQIARRGPQAAWRFHGEYPFIRSWGDASRIAAACGQVSVQAVSQWKRLPHRHLNTVAALLQVPAGVLRPDIDLVRLENGTPATLLELLLAWRLIKAARATLTQATQTMQAARAERDNTAARLNVAQEQLRRDRRVFRADLLDLRSQTIKRLRLDLHAAQEQAQMAEQARRRCYRSLIGLGIPHFLSLHNNILLIKTIFRTSP